MAVILRPIEPVRVPTNDVNISLELRHRAHKNLSLTMVSAVAHVWFNTFFEGGGPEQGGRPDDSGVFSIEWDAMDGIKGSSRKGARALDRISIVWRAADSDVDHAGEEVDQPGEDQPVPQMKAADWKGANHEASEADLGLRTQSPASADVSEASSVRSVEAGYDDHADGKSLEGVKSSGPQGEELDNHEKKEEQQAKEEEAK